MIDAIGMIVLGVAYGIYADIKDLSWKEQVITTIAMWLAITATSVVFHL